MWVRTHKFLDVSSISVNIGNNSTRACHQAVGDHNFRPLALASNSMFTYQLSVTYHPGRYYQLLSLTTPTKVCILPPKRFVAPSPLLGRVLQCAISIDELM